MAWKQVSPNEGWAMLVSGIGCAPKIVALRFFLPDDIVPHQAGKSRSVDVAAGPDGRELG
jgi:hypothetical protein